jgi:hypothetical protein
MADVILNITIPDAHVTRALDAFSTITDKHLTLTARGSEAPDFDGSWDFRIDPKDAGESNKQFGERCLRELGKAVINLVDLAQDTDRYKTDIDAVTSPESDVPTDVLT